MKEHVVKNNNRSFLPKNVRQVGDVDPDKRVYIEDYAFSFIRELVVDEEEEGRVGILLGEERKEGGDTYVFVRGAMEVTNASVYEGRVAFTEETWPGANAVKNRYFGGMDIVGWFLVSSSIRPEGNTALERTHIDSFGRYKLLLAVNPSERTEEVYSCFDSGLEQLDGYMIYFDKNEEMQNYMASDSWEHKATKADDMAVKRYRQLMRENKKEPKARQQLAVMYALSAVLVIFVLVMGAGRLQAEKNGEKTSETEQQGNYVEDTAAVNGTVGAVEDETLNIDYAQGEVDTTQPEETTPEPSSEPATEPSSEETTPEPSSEETTPEETTSEEVTTTEPETTTASHRVYVVQSGDTLSGIIEKEYGAFSTDILQQIFELNGITDGGNSINIGDELLLP